MAFYNLAQTQSHKRYLVVKCENIIRKKFMDYLDKAMHEQGQTEIIDYTVCRRCSVQYCDKRRCRKARR